LLLVLDNLEQVIDAAPALADLVEACPNLAVLATSRERLRVRGEVEFEVAPLAEPDAVQLFVARAGLHADARDDDAVHGLCRALDEMPLAIELAAARAKVLPPAQILERLGQRLDLFTGGRDADPRQRTLRSTIEWSHELLDPTEQRLFARLAVFAGGTTLTAAKRVADADVQTLGSLVEKSLVRRTEDRYWMYETIREFALERLDASGEAVTIRRGHAEYFLELAGEAEPYLRHWDEEWLDRLETELDNVRAALDHFDAMKQPELELRLCASFWWVWSLRGSVREGRRRVEHALGHSQPRQTLARADAMSAAAELTGNDGDLDASRAFAEEALALYLALGHMWGVAWVQGQLGMILAFEDRFAEAQPHLAESARGFQELGDEHEELSMKRRLAWAYQELGDLARAREIQEENLRRARAAGDAFMEASSLSALAQYDLDAGGVGPATRLLEEAHRIHRDRAGSPDRYWDAIVVCRLARALALKGEAFATIRLLACADIQFEELEINKSNSERWVVRMNDDTREMVSSTTDAVTAARAAEEGRKLPVEEAVEFALDLLR
jgi:predicted ATPase